MNSHLQRKSLFVTVIVTLFNLSLLRSVQADEPSSRSNSQVAATQEVIQSAGFQFWLYLPDDYTDRADDKFALMLFLHGGGEGGSDINKVLKNGPPKMIADGKSFPCIVVSPLNPSKTEFWDDQALAKLLDRIENDYRVDANRIYLTGLSRGGFGAWRMAMQFPNRFAALIPISGGGVESYAFKLKDLPIWAFHGGKDSLIPVEESQRMVTAVNKVGGTAKLTIYPEAKHDAWTQTYNNPEVFEWLFSQHR